MVNNSYSYKKQLERLNAARKLLADACLIIDEASSYDDLHSQCDSDGIYDSLLEKVRNSLHYVDSVSDAVEMMIQVDR